MIDTGMTSKEITAQIKKEERYIKRCQEKINDLRFDISATEGAIKFWNKQLKLALRKESKSRGWLMP